ncbi:MAG: hybrid sensor histidine kinase/response regulator, partial [Marinicella sp.]
VAEEAVAEEAVAEEEVAEEEVAEEAVAEEEVAEEAVAEEAVAEEEVAEEEVAEEAVAEEAVAEEEVAEEAEAEEEVAEEAEAEEEVAEEAVVEEVAEEVAEEEAEEEVAQEAAPEPFQQQVEQEPDQASIDATELELDEELLEIFSEEATEIFDRADHLLAELEEKPDSPAIIQALQRDLHTLKGGARMAGLNQIGDLSHQLESLFESIAEKKLEVSSGQHEMMSQIMHKLHGMVNSDDYGLTTSIENETQQLEDILSSEGAEIKEKSKLDEEFFDPLAQVDSPLVEQAETDEVEETVVQKKKANVLSGGQIKVNSELLDKLVNFAGEVSIYRSRMEQQSAELKLNIDELENTVERVRRQLRELEHETEAQIISNYQLEGDELEEDFDPLELDQFSTIQQLSRSLSESVSDLTNIQSYLQESARSSETLLIQQSRVNTELQEGLMETRLVTFNSLVPRLRRVLRTSGQELSKKAKLTVKGAEGEMDKTVLEGIQAPLEHMIRNAMVHGIEDNRKKAKKPEQGQIVIELSREATEVVITVSDDGAGINTKVLKKKAIDRGIIDKKDKMSDEEIAQLIIHSGLSAADEVTKLAGRGVGMDVVNNEIKRLGGSIEIVSDKGKGTTFVIRLPYTLALTQAIIVQVADHRYAIPASGVQGLIRMSIDEFRRRILENDLGYDYAGEQYQVQELNKLLSVDSEAMIEGNQVPLVMIKSGDQGVALRVDQTFGGREIVVKSVGTQVASVPGIFGATILGDGAVVLILDIIPMHRAYIQNLEKLEAEGVQIVEEVEEDSVITVMVVDDSITMRRAGERMLARNDFEVMTAKDGLDALNKLQEQKPDLMLLDIEMPRMDGFELATNMKASEKFKDIPIIMITSRTGQKHKDRAKEIGVERYLGKPYQEIELLDNIKDLLQLEDA